MKKIEVLQTFKHGSQTFYAGELRLVCVSDAALFCGAGWARADGLITGEPNQSPQVLDVHNSTIGQRATNLGA